MKREPLSKAFGDMDERYILEAYRPLPGDASRASERNAHMKKKRIITIALAAALTLALGLTAYAVRSVHAARQEALRAELRIDESGVSGYTEYVASAEPAGGLVLLSAVSDGQDQRVYVDISPVSEADLAYEEASPFPVFTVGIGDTMIGGSAYPALPAGEPLSGNGAYRAAVLREAYDAETQTLTLECFLDAASLEQAMAELGTETVPLTVCMRTGPAASRTFGPVPFTPTREQLRVFDFGRVLYHDEALDRNIELCGLELTPFSAVWMVHYEGDAALRAPGAAPEDTEPWFTLEDKICREAALIFSDGSAFSTGGTLSAGYDDGVVRLRCGWRSAIDTDDIQKIVLGDLVLWEAK